METTDNELCLSNPALWCTEISDGNDTVVLTVGTLNWIPGKKRKLGDGPRTSRSLGKVRRIHGGGNTQNRR